MRNNERKYADLGKLEELFEMLEQEIGKNIERTSKNKDSAYDYIRKVLIRMDEDMPRTRNYETFLEEVDMIVRTSRRDAEDRDETFIKGIMDKLKDELQEMVPNADYESIDVNKFMPIAQQMLATLEKELIEKEKAEVEYGVKVNNGHFIKLQDEFNQKAREMLTVEEREEAAIYVRRMRGEAEELEMVEKNGTEMTLTNVTRVFDEYIKFQRQIEESTEKTQNADNYAETSMSKEMEDALANAPIIDLGDVSPFDMEAIAQKQPVQPASTETMENIAPQTDEKSGDDNKGDLSYEVLRQPQYDASGKLITRGSAKTRSVGNMEDLAQGKRYVTIHDKDFDLTCTVEEAIKMLENERAVAQENARTNIDEMFL